MTAPVLIIGYGSLIWDLDDLAPRVRGGWRMGAGPRLPLEFSRISPKRKQSLVVVIDPDHGTDCATHVIESIRPTVGEAVADLTARERTSADFIGWVDLGAGAARSRIPGAPERIAAWCEGQGARGAVWTDLDANFEARTGRPFSIPSALAYLRGLTGESAAAAREYIDGAPRETDTALRRALAGEGWW